MKEEEHRKEKKPELSSSQRQKAETMTKHRRRGQTEDAEQREHWLTQERKQPAKNPPAEKEIVQKENLVTTQKNQAERKGDPAEVQ